MLLGLQASVINAGPSLLRFCDGLSLFCSFWIPALCKSRGQLCRTRWSSFAETILPTSMNTATYVLPLRFSCADGLAELAKYLRSLPRVEVIIVDGSTEEVFTEADTCFAGVGRHLKPDPRFAGLNGKVRGVLTGVAAASHDKIIIADDDVRYDADSLRRVIDALEIADVVRPQNYFTPTTWHTILDSGRSLLNRVTGGDWPGTLGINRRRLPNGRYNADVLFENLELVRTIEANGGTELVAYDIFVARRPPGARHFFSQRVRQAYDEFARPGRLIVALALGPLIAAGIVKPRFDILVLVALTIVGAAEIGRRRGGATKHFSILSSLLAPIWVLERAICSWLAIAMRLRYGGVRYAGSIIRSAATSPNQLAKLLP